MLPSGFKTKEEWNFYMHNYRKKQKIKIETAEKELRSIMSSLYQMEKW